MPSANVVQTSVSGGQQNALALQGDGVFLPKLSTANRTALTLGTSDKGFLAYDTTDNNVYIWNGSAWESVPASGDSANTQVIFNDNGTLAGDAGFTYDKTQARVQVGTRIDIWRGLNASSTNVAVGRSALSATQAGANANTAVGNQAGIGLTTGANNVFVGSNAGFGGGTGGNNVAVGVGSLTLNTAGSNNVAVGANSLFSSTTGDNVAIGSNALTLATSGASNTAVGSGSMSSQTVTGNFNVAVGVNAGTSLSSGANSVFVGLNAGNSATPITGNDNIGIGKDTLRSLSSGPRNLAIGTNSLNLVTTGTSNVGIGFNAGANITTGSSNICIGAASTALVATNSNQLSLGSASNWVATDGAPATYFATATAGAVVLGNALGFIQVNLNGTLVKIPVYGN